MNIGVSVLVAVSVLCLVAAATLGPVRGTGGLRALLADRVARVRHRGVNPAAVGLLEASGNPRGWTVEQLAHQQLVSASVAGAGCGGAGLLLSAALGVPLVGLVVAVPLAALGALLGWGSPLRTLRSYVNDRVTAVTWSMPSLLVTVSAALRSGATVQDAVVEGTLDLPVGTARTELELVQSQLTLGLPFVEAMQAWRDRVPCPLVDEVAQKLVDSLRTGVNAAESLTALAAKATNEAASLRRTRIQKVKLQIMAVTITCLAPAAGIFMIYPIAAQALGQLSSGMGGR